MPENETDFGANATNRDNSSQDELHAMRTPQKNNQTGNTQGEAPLNESHMNLMQSWHNLRGLDNKLAQTKYSDLAEGQKTIKGRRNI